MSSVPTPPNTPRAVSFLGETPPSPRVAAHRHYRWFVVLTVCIGAFMGQVDASIAQLVLPALEQTFVVPLTLVSWVAVVYLLTQAALLPIFGRLADIRGRKLLYINGFLLFIFGSAACGMAGSIETLIVFRIVQAVGAAMLSANSIAIIVAIAPPEERGRALGLQAAAQALGLTLGPLLGGALLQSLDWRWVFWINIPVGLIGMFAAWAILPMTPPNPTRERLDVAGALILVPALFALLLAINQAQDWGGYFAPLPLGLAVIGLGVLALFFLLEQRRAAPLIAPILLRNRHFLWGSMAGTAAYGMLFGLFLTMPFVLARVLADPPLIAGLRLAAIPSALAAAAMISGALSERLDSRWLTVPGMLICLAGLAWLWQTLVGRQPDATALTAAIAVVGLGQGLFISPNNRAIISVAPVTMRGAAGSVMNVFRAFGMSLGIAVATSLMAKHLAAQGAGASGALVSTLTVPPMIVAQAAASVTLALMGFALAALVFSLLASPRESSQRAELA